MLQKVTAGLQADNYPDIAYIYGSDLANLARGDQLVDLTDAIDSGDLDWDRFVDAGTEAVTVDDQPRAVPAFIDNLAVVYNKKIFDDAGVDYPTDDWTWDDFLATAAELNDPDAGIAGFGWPGTGDEDTTWRIWPLIWQQGGDIVSEDGTSVGFDGASGEAALDVVARGGRRRLGLHRQHRRLGAHAAAVRQRQDGDEHRRPVHAAGVRRRQGRLRRRGDAVVRRRAHDDRRARHLGDLRQRAEARGRRRVEFMDWFSEPEQQLRWITEAGSLPLTEDVEEPPDSRTTRRASRASTSSSRTPSSPGPGQRCPSTRRSHRRWARRSRSVLYGEADPAEALSEAVDAANTELQVPG